MSAFLGAAVAQYAFVPPFGSFKLLQGQHAPLLVFGASEVVVCLIVNRMHRIRRELLRVMATLEATETRFRLAQELSLDAFAILEAIRDDAGRVADFKWVYVNPVAMRTMGMTADDLSRTVLDVIPYAAQPGGLIERHGRVVETGEPSEYELFCGTPEEPRWFRNVVVRVGDGVAVTYADVTAERLAKDRLRESERNFRLAMTVGRTMAYRLGPDLRYSWVHSGHIGLDPAGIVGKTDVDVFEDATAQVLGRIYRRVWASGKGERADVTVRSRFMRHEQHFDLVVEPVFDDRGRIEELACAAYEVTARVKAQRAAEAARAEAERANDAKTRFLAAASHDLRQPIQGLRLLLHLLAEQATAPEQARVCGMMGETLNSTERMLGRLMEFAALESGKVTVSPQVFRLDELLSRIGAQSRAEAERKDLRLRVRTVPCATETDPVLLERIVRNLVSNAIRYTSSGGILVAIRRRGRTLRVEVWDTGGGIAQHQQALIFEEFRQLGNPERDRNKGMGLGLAIVARTVDLLGLRLDLRSQEGRGSRFAIDLPAVPPSTAARPVPAGRSPAAVSRAGILLVEDDGIQAAALTAILEDAGFRVTAARDAAAAQLAAEPPGPDLIVSDYRLPEGVSGLDVIRSARRRLGRPVPAVLITGDTQAIIAEQAASEACSVLHKPYTPAVLVETLNRLLLDRRAALSPAPTEAGAG